MSEIEKLQQAVKHIQTLHETSPDIGIVLGTGLSQLKDLMDIDWEINYEDIPNFPVSTVEFHSGKLLYGSIEGKRILAMEGRFHLYEGYSAKEVVFPIRVLKLLGIKKLIITNAAGGINLDYKKGALVLIEDHINLQNDNPLLGENIDSLGERFPDMSAPYSNNMMERFSAAAAMHNISIKTGVYAAVTGPNLETRAEYKYLKTIGADLVGMSTIPEVIAANHMGLPCIALSIVTDLCDPEHLEVVNIQDIISNAKIGEQQLLKIIPQFIKSLTF